MKGTRIELSTNNVLHVKQTFDYVKDIITRAEVRNIKFISLTDFKTNEPIMININNIVCF